MTGNDPKYDWVDEADDLERANPSMARAQGLYLGYMEQFVRVTGDREEISKIREQLREDETFWELAPQIVEIVEGKPDWISSIFRSESKRAMRQHAGRMEEIRKEREARIAAEKAAEVAELEAMPTFGMF